MVKIINLLILLLLITIGYIEVNIGVAQSIIFIGIIITIYGALILSINDFRYIFESKKLKEMKKKDELFNKIKTQSKISKYLNSEFIGGVILIYIGMQKHKVNDCLNVEYAIKLNLIIYAVFIVRQIILKYFEGKSKDYSDYYIWSFLISVITGIIIIMLLWIYIF